MKTPNTERTASDNVREFLRHKVGQTLTSSIIQAETAEDEGAVSGEVNRLRKKGALHLEKKVGGTSVYLVTPKISQIPLTNRKRPAHGLKPRNGRTSNTTAYKVESGIKLPANIGKASRTKYPFAEMKVGDSFRFAIEDSKTMKKVGNAAYNYGVKHGRKFTVAVIGKGKSGRCWRVK